MKVFVTGLKILISLIFTVFIGFSCYLYIFQSKENKLNFFSFPQGNMVSQKSLALLIYQHPNFSDAYFEKSVPFNKRGDFATGFRLLNKAVALKSNVHLAYRGWLRLRKLRDYDNSLIDLKNYDSLTPDVIDYPWGENLYFLKGECYFGKKEYEKAILEFNKALDTDKENADIHNYIYLGLCNYYLKRNNKAIFYFDKVLSMYNKTCEADYYLAKIYYEMNLLEKAEKHILKAEKNIDYKRQDFYNEFLDEVYLSEVIILKNKILKLQD